MRWIAPIIGFVLVGAFAAACSSAQSNQGDASDAGEDVDARMPRQTETDPAKEFPGCPSTRPFDEKPTTELAGADDLRARLPGIYRSCSRRSSLEIRLEEGALHYYYLDDRLVRTTVGGQIEIDACDGPRCEVVWFEMRDTVQNRSVGTIAVWFEPFTIGIYVTPFPPSDSQEWVRIGD